MTRIQITIHGRLVQATLEENEAARGFASLLPLEIDLEDYAATEKISDLPKRLDSKEAPEGYQASRGDMTYYAPWGNLAIFRKNFGFAKGLVFLGKIDSGIEVLDQPGPLPAVFEMLKNPEQ